MRYVVGFMMVAFFLGGVGLFGYGARELIRRFAARGRLRRAEGEIVRIDIRHETTGSGSGRTAEYHYPEIRFDPGRGGEQAFLAEIGAGARARRYAVGQKIGVLYDPEGEVPPMIDSWAGIWFPHLVRAIVGPLFIGAAVFIYWGFGDRIFGE